MKKSPFCMALALALTLTVSTRAQTSSLAVIEENGPRSKRVNIVFLSEGYTPADMPAFETHVTDVVNYLFSREPWRQYRSYCNVYRIQIASDEAGTDNGAGGGPRVTYFDSGFTTPSIPQLLTIPETGQSRVYTLLNRHVPEYDMPVMLVNDTTYGGSGGAIVVVSAHSLSSLIMEHEVGHSIAGLADEYDINYPIYTPSERYNVTQETDRNLVRWGSWIETTTPVLTPETSGYNNVVGVFEGATYRTNGWYRPHNNSLMRTLGQPVGSVNREKFVLSYYEIVSPLDGHSPETTTLDRTVLEPVTCSVTPKSPAEGPDLRIQWRVNGFDQAGETVTEFTIEGSELGQGTHTITATVSDPTTFVRNDPAALLSDSITWTINVAGVTLTISDEAQDFGFAGGTHDFDVVTKGSWSWLSSSGADWVTSGESPSQTGDQSFSYSVADNPLTSPRTAEITLTNGTYTRVHTITQGGRPALADLVHAAPASAPTSLVAGAGFSLSSNVRNNGTIAAGAFRINCYLLADMSFSASDIFLGSVSIPGADVNQTVPYSVTLNVPVATPEGSYYLGWIIDADDAVTESNESNNYIAFTTLRTVAGAALVPDISVPAELGLPESPSEWIGEVLVETLVIPVDNLGRAQLDIASINITGPNKANFVVTIFPAKIAALSSDSIEIAFDSSGLSTGAISATLQILSNDPDTPTAEILLSGGIAESFYPISSVTSATEQVGSDYLPATNLIQGPGTGFDHLWPHDAPGFVQGAVWVTDAPNGGSGDYFDPVPAVRPNMVFDLGRDVGLGEISFWGYADSNANGANLFRLRFATSADGPDGFGTSISYSPEFAPIQDQTQRQSFEFDQGVFARYVEWVPLDNFFGINPPGGDRVGAGEIAFAVRAVDNEIDILSIARGADGVTLTFKSRDGLSYAIFRSPDLGETGWQELDDSFASQGDETTFVDFNVPEGIQRMFYQVRNARITEEWLQLGTMPNPGRWGNIVSSSGGGIYHYAENAGGFVKYDTVAKSFSILPPPPHVTWGSASSWLNGKYYLIGGYNSSKMVVYDPVTNTWATLADSPRPGFVETVTVNGKIYMIGGTSGGVTGYYSACSVFDPSSGWSALPSLPNPRGRAALVTEGDNIYVIGGVGSSSGTATNSIYKFNTLTSTWSILPSMLTNRSYPYAVLHDGHIYITGGSFQSDQSSFERYQISTSSWVTLPPLELSGARATYIVYQHGSIYAPNNSQRFDLEKNQWFTFLSNPESRWGFPVSVNGKIYWVPNGAQGLNSFSVYEYNYSKEGK